MIVCNNHNSESSNMQLNSFFLPIISVLIFSYLIHKFLRPSEKLRLPPGPQKLPIIGNLHQLAEKNTPPHRRLREMARVHGPIMHLRLGEVSTVVVSSAEVAREVMKTHDANMANRPKLMAGEIIYYDFSDMVLAPYGEYWRQLRKIATLELFTAKRVQSFRHIRKEEVSKLVESLASDAKSGSVVNLSERLFSLLFNITSRVVFSREGEGHQAFRVFLTNLSNGVSGFSIAELYPSIKLLNSMSGLRRKLEKMVKESDTMLDPIIDEHISKKRQGIAEEDLIDVLLKFHKDNLEENTNSSFSLTTENIKAIILEIFGAGSETCYATTEWAMLELLKCPEAMERAQAEVRRVFQEKGTVDEESLNHLKFLKLVLKETLRLHPPVPLLVPRESIEHCQIHGYDIPCKTRVIVNAWAIARDPKYWTDPNMFKPERFDDSSVDYKGTNFEFIPFGAGRRMCPGVALGMAAVELALAMLLYHFDWKLPIGITPENLDIDELFGITMRRKSELHVTPVPCASA